MSAPDEKVSATVQVSRDAAKSACRSVSTSELFENVDNLKGKVVLITGAGSGIGAAFARLAASLGAKVVLADVNADAVASVADGLITHGESERDGLVTCAPKVNVTSWEEQRSLFEFVETKFGRVDVVVASAGVTEFVTPTFETDAFDEKGLLKAPNLRTVDINLIGSIYTSKLATHYMRKHRVKGHVVLLGSLSSIYPIPMGPMYSLSKHAIMGFVRSTHYTASAEGISVTMIAPWFTDTPILTDVRLLLVGLPFAKLEEVAQAILYASTTKSVAGGTLVVDPEGVMLLPHDMNLVDGGPEGFHQVFGRRAVVVVYTVVAIRDFARLVIGGLVRSPVALALLAGLGAFGAWRLSS